jgi:L-lactate dehydrogenase
MENTKIAVIGAGSVGSTVAYTLLLKNLASEIILIDVNETREEGEVMDIHDALPFVETGDIKRGDLPDAATADIIIVTAGLPQKQGETRLDLTKKNTDILRSIASQIPAIKKSAIVILVTNPVDVITSVAQEIFDLPQNQIIGTGTGLDTARLHSELSELLKVNASEIEGYVLGEHGDSGLSRGAP